MGSDTVGELQEALYRAAKANARRRFHALYDKLWRRLGLQPGPTAAHPASTGRPSRKSKKKASLNFWKSWRATYERRPTARVHCDECGFPSPTARDVAWESPRCETG